MTLKQYQNADCLPMVVYDGRPARIVATTFFSPSCKINPLDRSTWGGKIYTLDVFHSAGIYERIDVPAHLTQLPAKPEEPQSVSVAQNGWGRVIPFEAAKPQVETLF